MQEMRMELAEGCLLATIEDGVGLITFNRPEKHNAISIEMWAGLETVLRGWESDNDIRVVVLTGAGDKAFISGADISQFEKLRGNAEAQQEYDRLTSGGRNSLAMFPKPIIAKILGFCLGGGLAVAMDADLRIAADNAQFGIPAARLGIAYGFQNIRKLVSLVGPAQARMMLYTGNRIGATEAMRIGLLNQVVPNESLSEIVKDLAKTIAGNAPLSVRASKLIIDQIMRAPGDRDTEAVNRASIECLNSEDYREGRTAFLEKRAPIFRGR